jgi:hypothetical protein
VAVAFVNVGTGSGTTVTTGSETLTPAAPASMVVGNMIIVMAQMDAANATATNANVTTATGGWTEATDLAEYTAATPRQFVKLFWKVVDSTSMAMAAIAFSGMATGTSGGCATVRAHQFSGVDTTTPFGTSGAIFTAALATATTLGPVASPGAVAVGDMLFAAGGRSDDNSSQTNVVTNAPWTNLNTGTSQFTATGSDCSGWTAYTAGDGTDPGAITWSSMASVSSARTGRVWYLNQAVGAPAPPTLPVTMAPYVPTY